MNKNIIILALLASWQVAGAQMVDPIAAVLQQIEQNNPQLQALCEEVKAEVLETKSENNLANPEVNYAHLFNSERSSQQQSELTVVQGFDFPTAYVKRGQYNRLVSDAGKYRYEAERRDVLLEAKLLCLDVIGLNREAELLQMLSVHADSLAHLCDKRLEAGDATSLEVNRARLELMGLRTELADNAAAHRAALQRLLAMNGNQYIEQMVGSDYPVVPMLPDYEALCDEVMPRHRELLQAEAESKAARKGVSLNRQGWLPKLQVGYRRNTAPSEEFNGFVVGGSIPLFENRSKVKAAKARSLSAELRREAVALEAEASLQSLYNEARQLEEAMSAYDLPLMDATFRLLGESLRGGEISWHEYFVEMEVLARRKQSYLSLENRYHKLMAEIYADNL